MGWSLSAKSWALKALFVLNAGLTTALGAQQAAQAVPPESPLFPPLQVTAQETIARRFGIDNRAAEVVLIMPPAQLGDSINRRSIVAIRDELARRGIPAFFIASLDGTSTADSVIANVARIMRENDFGDSVDVAFWNMGHGIVTNIATGRWHDSAFVALPSRGPVDPRDIFHYTVVGENKHAQTVSLVEDMQRVIRGQGIEISSFSVLMRPCYGGSFTSGQIDTYFQDGAYLVSLSGGPELNYFSFDERMLAAIQNGTYNPQRDGVTALDVTAKALELGFRDYPAHTVLMVANGNDAILAPVRGDARRTNRLHLAQLQQGVDTAQQQHASPPVAIPAAP